VSFDLLTYAAEHRYRVRNLHDGRRVPPTRPPARGRRGRPSGYLGAADRLDVLACRHGYVCDNGNGRLGWYLVAPTTRSMRAKLGKLVRLGVNVQQEGDREAAGDAPVGQLAKVLQVLVPLQIPNHPGHRATLARQASAARAGSTSVAPEAGIAAEVVVWGCGAGSGRAAPGGMWGRRPWRLRLVQAATTEH
jgi:hypothetical protein